MTYLLRRLPPSRLLLLCGLVVVLGISITALAFALGTGPTPPAEAAPASGPRHARRGERATDRRRQRVGPADRPPARRRQPRQRRRRRSRSARVEPPARRRLGAAVDLQGWPRAPGAAVRKGRHPDLLRRAHRADVRRVLEHALPLHAPRPREGGSGRGRARGRARNRGRGRGPRTRITKSRASPRSKKPSPI